MSDDRDLEDLAKSSTEDFYALLDVPFDASEAAIKKAYRKASIRYHPDKNPDNKDAADRFIHLGWARDILLSTTLKAEYDRARTRRREKVLQDELMDSRRRKMKEDLERREQESRVHMQGWKRKRAEEMNEAEKREQEIQRLAADGKRRREEAQERLAKKRREESEEGKSRVQQQQQQQDTTPPVQEEDAIPDLDRTVKIQFYRDTAPSSWAEKSHLSSLFTKYGPIDSLVIAKDKKVRSTSGQDNEAGSSKHRKKLATVFLIYTRLAHATAATISAPSDFPILHSVTWAKDAMNPTSSTTHPTDEEKTGVPVSASSEKQTPLPQKSATMSSSSHNTTTTAPSTPFVTPKSKFASSFSASVGPGGLSTPKFSFSPKVMSSSASKQMEDRTMARLKIAEKLRLEEQIRRQEDAENAAEAAATAAKG